MADAAPMVDEQPAGMVGGAEIDRRMGYHPATADTIPLYEENRARYVQLACYLDQRMPPGRELAEALTTLQQSLMWANASVACNLAPLEDPAGRVPNVLVQQMAHDTITQTLHLDVKLPDGVDLETAARMITDQVRRQLDRSAAERSARL